MAGEIHDSDDGKHAMYLVQHTALLESIAGLQIKPVLHGSDGSTRKATTALAMLGWLGVNLSYPRSRVSDDNAYAGPLRHIASSSRPRALLTLRQHTTELLTSCNGTTDDHRHSGIRYVSSAQRHAGQDKAILAARRALYMSARALNSAC